MPLSASISASCIAASPRKKGFPWGKKKTNPRDFPAKLLRPFLKTDHGQIFWGDSRSYLFSKG